MSGVWRTVPIFVSSTFVDMHAERDHLRRFVFPELEERLRQRRCYLEPIDLRWGVAPGATTDERAVEHAVLKVCFHELGRSDHLVLGMLGERYGWIPPREPVAAATEGLGFAELPESRSVTELELSYALQRFPDRVLVYIRDPLPLDGMPPQLAAQYSDAHATTEDRDQRLGLLRQLKQRLSSEQPQAVRNYTAAWDARREGLGELDAWGQQVLVDAWTMLDVRTAELAAAESGPHAEEAWELEQFTAERLRVFVGRTELVDQLVNRLLHEPTGAQGRVVCVTGLPGSGKSALFSVLRARLAAPALVLDHAAGISKHSAEPSRMRERWTHLLEVDAGLASADAPSQPVERSETEKNTWFADLLARAAGRRRVVLLLDSLESLESLDACQSMRWLPAVLPADVVLAVTALPGRVAGAFPDGMANEHVDLPPLSREESHAIALELLRRVGKTLDQATLDRLLSKPHPETGVAAASPLWLAMAIAELVELDVEEFRRAEREGQGSAGERIGEMLQRVVDDLPPQIDALYFRVMDRVEKAHGVRATREFLNLIAVARAGLREADFKSLLSGTVGVRWTPLSFAGLRRALRGHIVQRGSDAQWTFAHEQMRSAVLARNLSDPAVLGRTHRKVAVMLMSSRSDDSLRQRQTLFHLLGGRDLDMATVYLASDLGPAERDDVCHDLMQTVMRTGADLIGELLSQSTLNDARRFALCLLILRADFAVINGGMPLSIRVSVLEAVEQTLERRFDANWPDAPARAEALGQCRSRLGGALSSMGRSEEGIRYASAAVEAKKAASAESASLELVQYHQQLGDHHRMRGECEPALAAYREAVQCARQLVAAEPADPDRRRDLLIALGKVHKCLDTFEMMPQIAGGDLPAELAEMGAIVDALLAEQPDHAALIDDKLIWFSATVHFYQYSNQPERAMQASADAQELGQRLYILRPDALDTKMTLATAFHDHAAALQKVGRLDECLAAEHKSIVILEQLVAADPSRAYWKRNLLASRIFLAGQIGARGNHADALAAYERAAAEAEVLARNEPTNQYLRSMYRQARRGKCACFVDLGRVDEAVEEMLLMLGVSRNSDGSLPESFPVANREEGEVVKKVLVAAGWAGA